MPAGAHADDGLYLPPAPRGPGGQDSVESSSGARCSQSINSSGPYLDIGVAVDSNRSRFSDRDSLDYSHERTDGAGALGYARIVIPLGEQPDRIDCLRLYELELQRLRQEIEMMRMGLE